MNAKKLLALFLAFVMLLSLCACGAKTEQPTEPKETVAEPTQTEAQDTPDETEAALAEATPAKATPAEATPIEASDFSKYSIWQL